MNRGAFLRSLLLSIPGLAVLAKYWPEHEVITFRDMWSDGKYPFPGVPYPTSIISETFPDVGIMKIRYKDREGAIHEVCADRAGGVITMPHDGTLIDVWTVIPSPDATISISQGKA